MTREEAIKELKKSDCKYAILTVDVWSGNELTYPNEKVVVSVLESQDMMDFFGRAYTVFGCLSDFVTSSVFGLEESKKNYTSYYFGDIKKINFFY